MFRSELEVVLWEPEDGLTPQAGMRVRSVKEFPNDSAAWGKCADYPRLNESDRHRAIAAALTASGVEWLDWISLRHGEDMLFAAGGRIYRLARWAKLREEDYLKEARMLADFRDMRFQ